MLRTAFAKKMFFGPSIAFGFAKFDRSKPHVNGNR